MLGYIDGTTGGMMLQIVMAGVVGGFVAMKLFAADILASVFGRFRGRPADGDGEALVAADTDDKAGSA